MMARFYPLYVRRSDGKLEIIVKGKRKEINQPTAEQLDQRPDRNGISDFYREVALDEPKHLDWRRKLGGMLARELKWQDKSGADNGYILVNFPENYRLYEHIKKTEKDGKTEVKNKTHAAGGNDRQDAYLYGHPAGKRKRFRSPNDFFPHLLWLCTDDSGDPDNCSCKICSPEDLENLVPGAKMKSERNPTQDIKPPVPQQTTAQTLGMQGARVKQDVGTRPVQTLQQRQPAPLPQPRSSDQKLDMQYHTFLYRPGELVWFRRGQAWGLGAILRRWLGRSGPNGTPSYSYTVQPLSYPFQHPAPVVKTSDSEMRPWLAWSVPKFTNDGLNQLQNPPRYETADWNGMMNQKYGTGDLEVDGSILAAKAVDSTYTLINQTKSFSPEPGVIETHFDGIFLGAEKIWVGEAARLSIGTGTDIMIVHSIIEQKRNSPVGVSQTVKLLGDMYTLAQVPHSNPNLPTPAAPNANPHLPQRLTEDLNYRNSKSIPIRGMASYWKLMIAQNRFDLDVIKGRWYEASRILPILEPERFADANSKGDIQESSLWMNARGDCLNSNRPPNLPRLPRENIPKRTRREAFGRAMPQNAEIKDGIQPPQPENIDPSLEGASGNADAIDIDPKFETADDAEGQGGLDEFMNLDGMDDGGGGMSNFAQEFGHGPGYF